MADNYTMRSAMGARAAQIDEGLRAHMNKVYGTMSVGMLNTALAAGNAAIKFSLHEVWITPNSMQVNIVSHALQSKSHLKLSSISIMLCVHCFHSP